MRRPRGFTLIELMIVVAIIGVLSAVAIPSFVKYIRRTHTVEAAMNLRKMYDGAVAYYVQEHGDAAGGITTKVFPDNAPTVPPLSVLTSATLATRGYLSSPSDWKQGGWQALEFQVSDRQLYSYTFQNTSSGPGVKASGNMIANGDLNGNQVYSTFMRSMHGSVEGVEGGVAMYTSMETE